MFDKELIEEVAGETEKILPEIISLRQLFHQYPEATWNESNTATIIAERLGAIAGVQVTTKVGKYGVVGTLKGAESGPVIGLRADMDGLLLKETSRLTYRSRNEGVMHACGHDGHMANLVGTAVVLGRLRHKLRGTVKFIFQPAEEGGHGALKMCEAGVLRDPDVEVIYGLHCWPGTPGGKIAIKSGPIMAAASHFEISILGTGCHAAMPHLGTDQVLIAARIIEALQDVAARRLAPEERIVLTITKFQGGSALNVIPDKVTLGGTLRTLDEEVMERVVHIVTEIAVHTAKAHGVDAKVEFTHDYPVTSNTKAAADYVRQVATGVLGAEQVVELAQPSMGAEDFSYFLQRIPGAFFFLGNDYSTPSRPLHHPEFNFNDNSLIHGIRLFTHLVLEHK